MKVFKARQRYVELSLSLRVNILDTRSLVSLLPAILTVENAHFNDGSYFPAIKS